MKQENRLTEDRREEDEKFIAPEVESAIKLLVNNDLATIVEQTLDKVLCKKLYSAQIAMLSVVYNFVEHVMLQLLCKEVFAEKLDSYVRKFLDMDEAAAGLWKRPLTSTFSCGQQQSFLSCRGDTTAMQDKKYITVGVPKDLLGALTTTDDEKKSLQSGYDTPGVRKLTPRVIQG